MPAPASLVERLRAVNQEHLVRFWDELSAGARDSLAAQIESLDLAALPGLVNEYVKHKPEFRVPTDVAPAPYYPLGGGRRWDRAAMKARGEDLVRRGKVAAFVVAGGQGSRLGFEGPKGCYPAGAVTNKPLFQMFAENLLGVRDRLGVCPPWYIMTSPLNHAATVSFFEQNGFFGLSRGDVMFFPQGVMPSLDIRSGRVLLAGKGEVATNPDGHGGCIKALQVSGALADMRRRGVEHLSYFQVDNPLVRVIDPVFVGLHAAAPDSSGEMSSKMVTKTGPEEKVGVFCTAGGKVQVLEYSDLPAELQQRREADGSLRFIAGSIAIHLMSVEFLERLAGDARFALPYHRAEKKVPCVDPETGAAVQPTSNNGVKLEKFVFDALPLCRSSIVMEVDRAEEFGPIKNASGVDSVETSKTLQSARAARWLEARGVRVARRPDGTPDCTLEISPRTATAPEELSAGNLPSEVKAGERLAL